MSHPFYKAPGSRKAWNHHLLQSFAKSPSQTGDGDSELGIEHRDITPTTSFTEQGALKRSKKKVAK
jgi:hypothetical protein